jgi:predicted Rossmann fold nucleotide-binding protein DprA/Smf involved in DNA uptake
VNSYPAMADLFDPPVPTEAPKPRPVIQEGDSIIPRARNGDALTSHEAAANAKTFATDHRACILGVMWRALDASRIAKFTGLSIEQVCRRLPELEEAGRVRLTGATVVGLNGSKFREWERIK